MTFTPIFYEIEAIKRRYSPKNAIDDKFAADMAESIKSKKIANISIAIFFLFIVWIAVN